MHRTLLPILALLALGACSSTPDPKAQRQPGLENEFRERDKQAKDALAQQAELDRVLLDIDKQLDKYVQALWNSGNDRADQLAAAIEKSLRDTVTKHYGSLLHTAIGHDTVGNRAIALGALGFAQKPEALDALLNALGDADASVVANATFALGILHDPRTPPRALGAVLERESSTQELRRTASWALMRVQESLHVPTETLPVWKAVLAKPVKEVDAGVLVHTARAIGFLRKQELSPLVVPLLQHPDAKVRETAAISLGRLRDPKVHEALLTLIGPAESNANVRLAARKALKALAGDVDVGYEVAEWRKLFQRGN